MKPILRNALILIAPFMLMVLVNETIRPLVNSKSYTYKGSACINASEIDKNFCSWACLNTDYCNANHSKILQHKKLDPVYLGIVNALRSGVGYTAMNIIFLVILIPCCIWFFTVKALNIQDKISKLKKMQNL